jgi:hypothetical protein
MTKALWLLFGLCLITAAPLPHPQDLAVFFPYPYTASHLTTVEAPGGNKIQSRPQETCRWTGPSREKSYGQKDQ